MTLTETQLKSLLKRFDPIEPVDIDKVIAEIIKIRLNELSKNLRQEFLQVVGEKGERGERGKDGISKDGRDGEKGDKPVAGVDFPIPKDGKDGIAKDGKRGLRGIDGSPDEPEVIKEKLETLKGEDRLDASAIKNLPEPVLGRTIHRGGINFESEVILSGTVNGTNKVFTIPTAKPTPKIGGFSPITLNGIRQRRGGVDYTVSTDNRTYTFVTAPPGAGQSPIIDYEAD